MSQSTKVSKSGEDAALAHPQRPFSGLGIQFLSSVRRTLTFERALRKYTSCDILCFIESMISHHMDASQDVLSSSSFLHYDHDDESSSELDTVLSLVIDKAALDEWRRRCLLVRRRGLRTSERAPVPGTVQAQLLHRVRLERVGAPGVCERGRVRSGTH